MSSMRPTSTMHHRMLGREDQRLRREATGRELGWEAVASEPVNENETAVGLV
jgi:hypothetical protein